MSSIVGSVAVQVVPSAKGFSKALAAQVLPDANKLGAQIGEQMGARIRESLGIEMRDLPGGTVNIDADTGKAETEIAALGAEAEALGRESPTITPNVNSAPALAGISSVRVALLGLIAVGSVEALGAIGPTLGALAGLAGIAAVAVPAVSSITKVMQAQTQAQDGTQKSLEAYDQALQKLTPSEQAAMSAFTGFKSVFMDWQRSLEPTVIPLFTKALDAMRPLLFDLAPVVQSVAGAIGDLISKMNAWLQSPAASNLFGELAKAGASAVNTLGSILGGIGSFVAKLMPTIQPLASALTSALGGALTAVGNALLPVIGALSEALPPILAQLEPVVAELAGELGGLLAGAVQALAPLLPPVITAIGGIVHAIAPLIPQIVQAAMVVGQQLALALASILPVAVQLVVALLPLVPSLLQLVAAASRLIPPLVQLDAAVLPAVIDWLGLLATAASKVIDVVAKLVDAAADSLSSVADKFSDMAKSATESLKAAVGELESFASSIGGLPSRIASIAVGMFDGIKHAAQDAINWVKQQFENLLDYIKHIPSEIADATKGMVGDVVHGALGGLKQLGNDILPGSPFGAAEGAVVNPRPGGTIVRVAEAGRPEAIVPLDKYSIGGGDTAAEIRGLRDDVRQLIAVTDASAEKTGAAVGNTLNANDRATMRRHIQLVRQGAPALA